MNSLISADLKQRLRHWSDRLQASGLEGLAAAMLDAMEPLGPLGAQALWVAQPALGLLVDRAAIAELAELLDNPAGIALLRDELTAPSKEDV